MTERCGSSFVASLGDPNALASLKAIRYTTEISAGAEASAVKVEVMQTRIYPDRLVMITHIPGGLESHLEASPAGASRQVLGGSKTNLPGAMRDELLKTVRRDRFYIGQNVGSGKVTVTETGTERIGDVEAAVLRLNVDGADATWYVSRADGKLLRTVTKVPAATGMVDSVVDYSDWRSCEGLVVPFQRAITEGGKFSRERVLGVEFNPSLVTSEKEKLRKPIPTEAAPASGAAGRVMAARNAGGQWEIEPRKDAMTDRPSVVFSLNANGQPGYLAFRCSGEGRFEKAWFHPGVVLDNSTTAQRGLLGGEQPNQFVRVRVDSKFKLHWWFVSVDLMALEIGKRDFEEILNAQDYRIQFTEAFRGGDVRSFSPAGIDRQLVKRACGI